MTNNVSGVLYEYVEDHLPTPKATNKRVSCGRFHNELGEYNPLRGSGKGVVNN